MEIRWSTVPAMLQLETKSTSAITALAFSPDGMRLLVGYAKGPVQEWDAFGSLLHEMEEDHGGTESPAIAWSPKGEMCVYSTGTAYVEVKRGEVMGRWGLGPS